MQAVIVTIIVLVLLPFAVLLLAWLFGVRYIPHNSVGIVEKLWSPKGSLSEGVYAINQALFVVIGEDLVFTGPIRDKEEKTYQDWQAQLYGQSGFNPVLIGFGTAGAAAERDVPRVPGTERDPQSVLQVIDT